MKDERTAAMGTAQGRAGGGESIGTVVAEMPSQLFRVRLASGHVVAAAATGRHRLDFLRLLPGDRVRVRVSSRDVTRGRILGRVDT